MKHESLSPPPAGGAPSPSQAHEPRWTTRKIIEFLRALAATHSVKDAASVVSAATGQPRRQVYARALQISAGREK